VVNIEPCWDGQGKKVGTRRESPTPALGKRSCRSAANHDDAESIIIKLIDPSQNPTLSDVLRLAQSPMGLPIIGLPQSNPKPQTPMLPSLSVFNLSKWAHTSFSFTRFGWRQRPPWPEEKEGRNWVGWNRLCMTTRCFIFGGLFFFFFCLLAGLASSVIGIRNQV